jgi:multiple sugar transport system ATP-binding protein
LGAASTVSVGIRPESMDLASDGIPAAVEVVEELGADAFIFAQADLEGRAVKLVARVEARRRPVHGEEVRLRPRLEDAHLFHPDSGSRLDA